MSTQETLSVCNHTSVGVIVFSPNAHFLLLQERARFPFGMACPAGHVDEGETYAHAAKRELHEETGLEVISLHLVLEGMFQNQCRRPDGTHHYWKVYVATTDGVLRPSKTEVRRIHWYESEQVHAFARETEYYRQGKITQENWDALPGLEPVWYDILKMLAETGEPELKERLRLFLHL